MNCKNKICKLASLFSSYINIKYQIQNLIFHSKTHISEVKLYSFWPNITERNLLIRHMSLAQKKVESPRSDSRLNALQDEVEELREEAEQTERQVQRLSEALDIKEEENANLSTHIFKLFLNIRLINCLLFICTS